MRKHLTRLVPAALASIVAACAISLAWAQAAMTVQISGKYMISGTAAVIEVMDRNCGNRIAGRWTVQANQAVSISVCRDGAGYANIATRNVTDNGDWHGASLLKEGEVVYP